MDDSIYSDIFIANVVVGLASVFALIISMASMIRPQYGIHLE